MKLIGMLDSPYVRRVAVSLECLGVPFEHVALSVFSTFEAFRAVNPVVKAPTLVCDDGEVLMESSLILEFIEATRAGGRSLWPHDTRERQHDVRAVGLALAACEKAVQTVYERNLRPAAAQYEPWMDRVRGQLLAACGGLDRDVDRRPGAFGGFSHASIAAGIAWHFIQAELPALVPASDHPALVKLSLRLEATPEFRKYPPTGPGVPGTGRDGG